LAKENTETLDKKFGRTAKLKTIGRFIRRIRGTSELLAQFDETLWNAIVDSITVTKAGRMVLRFKDGSVINDNRSESWKC